MSFNTLIATTGKSVARATRAAGGAWSVETLLPETQVNCLAAGPHAPNVAYAGTQGQGVLRSEDWGKSWQPAGLEGQVVKSLACSPLDAGVLYAGTKPPLFFVSRDHGRSWTELEAFRRMRRWWWRQPAEWPSTTYIQAIALSPTDPNLIMVGVEACGVFRSADGGQSWTGHVNGSVRDCHTLTFHPTNGDWVYEAGGSGGGVAVSRDAGITWSQPKEGLDRRYGWACTADPIRPEVWYASLSPSAFKAHSANDARAYIFRSTENGRWEKLYGGLPQPLDYMAYALLTDPESPGHLYAGLSNGDVWQSADYGESWQQLPFNLGRIGRSMIMLHDK